MCPEALVGDARRSAPLRRRRPSAARRALRRRGRRVRAPRRRRRLGPELRELAQAIHDLTEGNAFLVCELWRALVETGAVERRGRTIRLARPPAEIGEPGERPRGRQPAALAARRRRPPICSSSPPSPGPEFELDVVRRAAGSTSPSCSARLDEAVRSGMIEELPPPGLAYRFTHELVRRALYDRLSAHAAGRAPSARRRGARGAPAAARAGRSPTSRITSPPPRRSAGPSAAVEYNVLRGARPHRGARLRRGGGAAAHRARAGDRRRRAARRGRSSSSGGASHRGGQGARRAARRSGRRRRSPGSSATAELLARAAIGFEDACWRPGIADQGAVELLEEALAALGERRTRSCGSGCSAGSRARSTSRATTSARAVVRDERGRDGAASSRTARVSPRS